MFAKFILVLSLFTGLSASALPDGDGCEESLEVSPSLIQIAKKEALAQFNSSPLTVMRYIDSQVINKIYKGDDGTLTFDVGVIYGYQPGETDRKSNYLVRLDGDGNSLDVPGFFGMPVPPITKPTKPKIENVQVDPKLMQAAKEAALAKFNMSPLLVMRYVDGQIVKSIVKNENGSFTFVVDILFNYGSTETQTDTQTVILDVTGKPWDEIDLSNKMPAHLFIRATKAPKVGNLAVEEENVREAVRDFIENESPYRTITSIGLELSKDETTGERKYLASVKVNLPTPGTRLIFDKGLWFYNAVVSSDGKITITAAGGQNKPVDLVAEQARVERAVRDFIQNKTPGRLVTGLDLEMTENKSTGEHNYFASVKVQMPPLGERIKFYNIVVLSNGTISISESGGQG